MPRTLYRYNAETCQYERVRVKTPDVVSYALGVLVMAAAMLAGILALHDYVFDSDKEVALRNENAALAKNRVVLTSQISTIESALSTLDAEDKKLHAKFFGTAGQPVAEETRASSDNGLLSATPDSFRSALDIINAKTSALLDRSAATNIAFAGNSTVLSNIASLPSLQPLAMWESDRLLSGFGMRVNPFHKGLYEHPGIDVAVPRGTPVIATAAGKVREIKRSNLEAGYGNFVEIDHGSGFVTRYAHLDEINVRSGQKIEKGAVIGLTGSSGGSIAPHLHYEVIRNGEQVDPVHYMIEGLSSAEYDRLKAISHKQNQSLD